MAKKKKDKKLRVRHEGARHPIDPIIDELDNIISNIHQTDVSKNIDSFFKALSQVCGKFAAYANDDLMKNEPDALLKSYENIRGIVIEHSDDIAKMNKRMVDMAVVIKKNNKELKRQVRNLDSANAELCLSDEVTTLSISDLKKQIDEMQVQILALTEKPPKPPVRKSKPIAAKVTAKTESKPPTSKKRTGKK